MTSRRAGLEAIILYKLIKAGAEALAGIAALVALGAGAEVLAASLAQMLLDHATHEWALEAARLIEFAGTRHNLLIVVVASFADAALSAVEGLALRAGRWWAPWLVVVATGSLLPWEFTEIVRHPHWSRGLLLVVNLAVLIYLLLGAMREHRERDLALQVAQRAAQARGAGEPLGAREPQASQADSALSAQKEQTAQTERNAETPPASPSAAPAPPAQTKP